MKKQSKFGKLTKKKNVSEANVQPEESEDTC